MIVIFIIGVSIMTASSMSSGVAFRYREAKSCYYYTKELSRILTKDIKDFSIDNADPWCRIAQSVYDVKAANSERSVVLSDVNLNMSLPLFSGEDIPRTTMKIILPEKDQVMNQYVQFMSATTNDEGEIITEERLEKAKVQFSMILELRTRYRNQDYVIYLKYKFDGDTEGIPGAGEGSGVIISGSFTYDSASESL